MNLTRNQLKKAADAGSWHRGMEYFRSGNVVEVTSDGDDVVGVVIGQRQYQVRLSRSSRGVSGNCSCPMGNERVFCKHCVAVGLEWISSGGKAVTDGKATPARTRPSKRRVATYDDVRKYLADQPISDLVETIVQQAMRDDALRRRLFLRATEQKAGGADADAVRTMIDEATRTGGFVDWSEASGFAEGVGEAVEAIGRLLPEHAAEAIELAEHALRRLEKAMESMDDSDGYAGGILERLQEIHLKACEIANPAPEALARRLFQWEMASGYGAFDGAVETYSKILGEKGLAAYEKEARAAWNQMLALRPDQHGSYDHRRFILTAIMEALARLRGDLEGVVAIKSRDLSSPHQYLDIAKIYKEARQRDKALEWAEKGISAFAAHPNAELSEFLADEYHQRKSHDDAMKILWRFFESSPSVPAYESLKAHAERAAQWLAWREKALGLVRNCPKPKRSWQGDPQAQWSLLVDIFIWEKDVEAAWQEACNGGASASQMLDLAKRRENKHPEDAIPVYRAEADRLVQGLGNDVYAQAADMLRALARLMRRTGQEAQFRSYVEGIRAAQRRKRNLIKRLQKIA